MGANKIDFSWSNGNSPTRMAETTKGVMVATEGGIEFSVTLPPAATSTSLITVYVGSFFTAARFSAMLSCTGARAMPIAATTNYTYQDGSINSNMEGRHNLAFVLIANCPSAHPTGSTGASPGKIVVRWTHATTDATIAASIVSPFAAIEGRLLQGGAVLGTSTSFSDRTSLTKKKGPLDWVAFLSASAPGTSSSAGCSSSMELDRKMGSPHLISGLTRYATPFCFRVACAITRACCVVSAGLVQM
jgi:hypothetical protein